MYSSVTKVRRIIENTNDRFKTNEVNISIQTECYLATSERRYQNLLVDRSLFARVLISSHQRYQFAGHFGNSTNLGPDLVPGVQLFLDFFGSNQQNGSSTHFISSPA